MKKPHIWFDDCLWVCGVGRRDWAEGWGETPELAYKEWRYFCERS